MVDVEDDDDDDDEDDDDDDVFVEPSRAPDVAPSVLTDGPVWTVRPG
jgi:hypothetical protein